MISVSSHPKLSDLHRLIAEVPAYPIRAGALTRLAAARRFPEEVVDFYRSFPADETFFDQEDVLNRTEIIELMETESQPLEDTVHGAED